MKRAPLDSNPSPPLHRKGILKMTHPDWTGNSRAAMAALCPSNHSQTPRSANDYYATEPRAVELLCDIERFAPAIWEPACGEGHISKVLRSRGYAVRESDLIDRIGNPTLDFLSPDNTAKWDGDIITNPPYSKATEFVEKSLSLVKPGAKVAMFLKLTFLESKSRRELFRKSPPRRVWVSSSRLHCLPDGKPCTARLVAYAWFVWERGFRGDPVIKWFN